MVIVLPLAEVVTFVPPKILNEFKEGLAVPVSAEKLVGIVATSETSKATVTVAAEADVVIPVPPRTLIFDPDSVAAPESVVNVVSPPPPPVALIVSVSPEPDVVTLVPPMALITPATGVTVPESVTMLVTEPDELVTEIIPACDM